MTHPSAPSSERTELALSASSSSSCGCGCTDEGVPELDVRQIPHAIRHATVFGALAAIPEGGAMVLVAPHDPTPLLGQIEQREQGSIEVTYLDEGPEAWRLRLTRRG